MRLKSTAFELEATSAEVRALWELAAMWVEAHEEVECFEGVSLWRRMDQLAYNLCSLMPKQARPASFSRLSSLPRIGVLFGKVMRLKGNLTRVYLTVDELSALASALEVRSDLDNNDGGAEIEDAMIGLSPLLKIAEAA